MPDKILYYAVIDELSSREHPLACSAAPIRRQVVCVMRRLPEIWSGGVAHR